jgi:hypothetical protein
MTRLEDEVRSVFREKAASLKVDEAKNWTELEQGIGTDRPPSALGRAAIIALSLVVGLSTLVAVVAAISRSPSNPVAEPVEPVTLGPITDVLPLTGSPESIALGDDAVWVSTTSRQECSSGLTKVDAEDATVSTDATLGILVEDMAFAFDHLWAVGVTCRLEAGYDGVVARIDPASLEIEAEIEVAPGAVANGIAATPENVVVGVGQANGNEGSLTLLDPHSGEITRSMVFDGIVGGLQYESSALWVSVLQPPSSATQATAVVARVEPATLDIEASAAVDEFGSLSVGDEIAWVSTGADEALALAASDLRPLRDPFLVSMGGGFVPFEVDDSGVWFLTEDEGGRAELGHLSANAQEDESRLRIGGQPVQALRDDSTDSIWVIDYRYELVRVLAAIG